MLDVVLGDLVELFQLVASFSATMSHSNACLLGKLVNDLHQIPSPLLVQRGNRNAYDPALRHRIQPEVGLAKTLFDSLRQTLVPRSNREKTRLGCRHTGNLVERHRLSVGLDLHGVEKAHARFPGSDRSELALRALECLLHSGTGVLDDLRYRVH